MRIIKSHKLPAGIGNTVKDAKQVIDQTKAICKCPNCSFHKNEIIECAKRGHRIAEAKPEL